MMQDAPTSDRQRLQNLMQQAGIVDIDELSHKARVARLQLIRIEQGLILNLSLRAIVKIARTLNISLDDLLTTFAVPTVIKNTPEAIAPATDSEDDLAACRQEYARLEEKIVQQQSRLALEFQQHSLETIESWLLQWPTAATAVRQNPQLPANRLLSLVEPVEELVRHWNVSPIATVGEELAYDPQQHQLMKGTAQPGELVKVRYVGYKQGDKLLHKAKVSPVV